jgi:hypothetical protein
MTERSRVHELSGFLFFLVTVATIGPLQFGYHLAELNTPEAVIRCQKDSVQLTIPGANLPKCIPMNDHQYGTPFPKAPILKLVLY